MRKAFLYLYPIEEYMDFFLSNEDDYGEYNVPYCLHVLNECINKRYRMKGYEIIYALFPNKEVYGLDFYKGDRLIYTDILFEEFGKKGMYPCNFLIKQLENIDKLVIGGFHYSDCVKKLGEAALRNGIDTSVDLDLTDLFFNLYKENDYLDMEYYNPDRFRECMVNLEDRKYRIYAERQFVINFSSPAYGFEFQKVKKLQL